MKVQNAMERPWHVESREMGCRAQADCDAAGYVCWVWAWGYELETQCRQMTLRIFQVFFVIDPTFEEFIGLHLH